MNRFLQYFNLGGILSLAILCAFQWQANRKANLKIIELENRSVEQVSRLEEQAKSLKGSAADLDDFRQQITQLQEALKESETKITASDRKNRDLLEECEQLKSSLTNWTAAVSARDAQLKETRNKLEPLLQDRNEITLKFNALATRYNETVKDLDAARATLAAMASASTNKNR